METQELVVQRQEDTRVVRADDFMPIFGLEQIKARQTAMSQFIGAILKTDIDFGEIPGASKTKVLLKPGAEKLCSFFGLTPMFIPEQVTEDWSGKDHDGEALFYYRYKCQLWRGERLLAEAVGSCNSREKKYRFRNGERKCPDCGKATIIKGRAEYGGGFICFAKKGGCGAKFGDNDPAIIGQEVGQVANPDIYDVVNTCQKMAQKRALVAAVLIGTNASDSFTQDIEEGEHIDTGGHPVGTQAASEHVRDQKLGRAQQVPAAPASSGNGSGSVPPTVSAPDVPEELQAIFADLKPSTFRKYGDVLYKELSGAMPTTADIEFGRLEKKYGLDKSGPKDVATVKLFLLEVWNLAQYAKSLRTTEAA